MKPLDFYETIGLQWTHAVFMKPLDFYETIGNPWNFPSRDRKFLKMKFRWSDFFLITNQVLKFSHLVIENFWIWSSPNRKFSLTSHALIEKFLKWVMSWSKNFKFGHCLKKIFWIWPIRDHIGDCIVPCIVPW